MNGDNKKAIKHIRRACEILHYDFGAPKKVKREGATVVYLVRHGWAEHNEYFDHKGPSSLVDLGRKQAKQSAKTIDKDIEHKETLHFHVSPLTRTLQTFIQLVTYLSRTFTITWSINTNAIERFDNHDNSRVHDAKSIEKVFENEGIELIEKSDQDFEKLEQSLRDRRIFEENKKSKKKRDYETHEEAGERLHNVIQELSGKGPHVIVTHGGIIKGYLQSRQQDPKKCVCVYSGEVIRLKFDSSRSLNDAEMKLCSIVHNQQEYDPNEKADLEKRWVLTPRAPSSASLQVKDDRASAKRRSKAVSWLCH